MAASAQVLRNVRKMRRDLSEINRRLDRIDGGSLATISYPPESLAEQIADLLGHIQHPSAVLGEP